MSLRGQEKVLSIEDFYLQLIEKYPGLTINDLANLNHYQKTILNRGPSTVTFSGPDAHEQFLALQAQLKQRTIQ